jgi:hypothetical protein
LPELSQMLAVVRRELGTGGEPADIKSIYGAARNQLNQGYDQAGPDTLGLLKQQALQSGQRFLPGQVQGAYSSYLTGLEQDRSQALRRLQFGEQQAGLSQYDQLLNLLGQGAGEGLNLARGYTANQAAAIGGLSQSSQFGSTLGGATAGAGLGASVGGVYGAAAGAIGGGLLGYFGNGG